MFGTSVSPDKSVQYSHAGSAVSFSADALLPCQGGRAPSGIWRALCVPDGLSVCGSGLACIRQSRGKQILTFYSKPYLVNPEKLRIFK